MQNTPSSSQGAKNPATPNPPPSAKSAPPAPGAKSAPPTQDSKSAPAGGKNAPPLPQGGKSAPPDVKSTPPTQRRSSLATTSSSKSPPPTAWDDFGDDDDDLQDHFMIIPPDGGWGWVIMVCGFYCNVLTSGMQFSIGSYAIELQEKLGATMGDISLLGAIQAAFINLFGPIAGALVNRFGFRIVLIAGGVIASTGYMVSFYAKSMVFLYITFGFVAGVGFCLIFLPFSIATSFYFQKWRALTSCIVVCGAGVGGAIVPPVVEFLITSQGWEMSLLIQGIALLSVCLAGTLYRPLMPVRIQMQGDENYEAARIKSTRTLMMDSRMSFGQSILSTRRMTGFVGLANHKYPTLANNNTGSTITVVNRKNTRTSTYSLFQKFPNDEESGRRTKSRVGSQISIRRLPRDQAGRMGSLISVRRLHREIGINNQSFGTDRLLLTGVQEDENKKERCGCCLDLCGCCNSKYKYFGARPLYRDDAFYNSTLKRVKEHQPDEDPLGYHMTVTRMTTIDDIEEEQSSKCICFPESVKRTLATMLDFSLFQSPSFLILLINGCFANAALMVPFIYVPARVAFLGVDPAIASTLISVISIASTISRMCFGIVTSVPCANVTLINFLCLTLGGVALMISGISNEGWFHIWYCSMFGLGQACFYSLRTVMIVELLGIENLTNAFGLLLLFQGIAAFVGPPIAGSIFQMRDNYTDVFMFAGSLLILAAIVTIPLPWINKREKKAVRGGVT